MDYVLSIVCIIFFCTFNNYYIKGYNTLRRHKYNCKTLYIPEDFDIDRGVRNSYGATRDELKKEH